MKKATRILLRDYGLTVGVAVAVALLIRGYVIEAYRIPSQSMKPTLEPGDTIFVLKWPYLISKRIPKRGEIVVFRGAAAPGDRGYDYIKRVIGLPGDTVEVKKGEVLLNGTNLSTDPSDKRPCTEDRLPEGPTISTCREPPLLDGYGPEKVPEGSVFVVGDLRTQSPADIRKPKTWGIIPDSSIKGRAQWIWLSIEPGSSWFPTFRFNRMFRRIH